MQQDGVAEVKSRLGQARTIISPPSRKVHLNLAEMWLFRELLYFFVWRDVKVRYKQTVIGAAWAILQPFLTMVVFTLVFGQLANLPSGNLPDPVFYYSGLLPWLYFANSLNTSTGSIVANQGLIGKVYFPRLFLPLSSVFAGLLDFLLAFTVLLAIMLVYGVIPAISVVLLPFFILLVTLTAAGAGILLASLNAMFRDIRYVIPFAIQFWLFASPVAYPAELVPEKWEWLLAINPMAGAIEGFRWALTGVGGAPIRLIIGSVLSIALLTLGGLYFFRRTEDFIADVV